MRLDPAQLQEQLQNAPVSPVKPDLDLGKHAALAEVIDEMRREQVTNNRAAPRPKRTTQWKPAKYRPNTRGRGLKGMQSIL